MGWLTWPLAKYPIFRCRLVISAKRVFMVVNPDVVRRTRRVGRVVFHGQHKWAAVNFHVSPASSTG